MAGKGDNRRPATDNKERNSWYDNIDWDYNPKLLKKVQDKVNRNISEFIKGQHAEDK